MTSLIATSTRIKVVVVVEVVDEVDVVVELVVDVDVELVVDVDVVVVVYGGALETNSVRIGW